MREFQCRILNVMMSFYLERFEEGIISRQSAETLQRAVEVALDTNNLELHYLEILKCFSVSKLEREIGKCTKKLLFLKLRTAVECGIMFMKSSNSVRRTLKHIPEIAESAECQQLFQQLKTQCDAIRQEWLGLQQSYPDLYRAIQTNFGVVSVMHAEGKEIDQLRLHGLLDDSEHERMRAMLSEAHHSLNLVTFHSMTMGKEDKERMLERLPFVTKLDPKTKREKVEHLKVHAKMVATNRGKTIYKEGGEVEGVVIIIRGTADVVLGGKTVDTVTSGAILCWELLVGKTFESRLAAKTSAEHYFLKKKHLDHLLEGEQEATESLWRSVGLQLIFERFRDHFAHQTRIELAQMTLNADYYETQSVEEAQLDKMVLLMKGTCLQARGKMIRAPALLGPGGQARFKSGCIMLKMRAPEQVKAMDKMCALMGTKNSRLKTIIKGSNFRSMMLGLAKAEKEEEKTQKDEKKEDKKEKNKQKADEIIWE